MLNNIRVENKEYIPKTNEYYNIIFENIKDIIKNGFSIVNLSFLNEDFINKIDHYLNSNCNIINFCNNYKDFLKLNLIFFSNKNILFNMTDLKNNYLKNNSIDLLLGQNVINNKKNLYEIERILKPDGKFIFLELVSVEALPYNFKRFISNSNSMLSNIIFDIDSKMKIKYNYEVKPLCNGNFYFGENEIKKLQDFCDLHGFNIKKRNDILSKIFLVMIKGSIKKK
ncbi:MAG TPA: hypothetical protein PLE45_01110 [Spirochaetota bacterium]|nr:hypothetical protein [Spirochaetota bacterium]HOL56066.1 hypothetical protein [Spirochaetota bacterium]HPP03212.1 hypothetical protein [Spirochaetota bacterium]